MRTRRSILLGAALSALLLVIGGSTSAIWWNAKNSQERIANLQKAHMQAGVALASIRANVFLNAILTRDYLLDSDPSNSQKYIQQFESIQAGTEEDFRILDALRLDDEQRGALEQLHKELTAYWDPTEVVLDWTPEERRVQRAEMLRQRVRRREEIFALAGQVEHLVSANFAKERQRVTDLDQEFRMSLGWTAGIALLCGLGIAAGTLTRMLMLERQSQVAESQLRLLSGQLRTAQEQERKYLSRELHDQVGQLLTGVRMELAGIARLHADPESELSTRITRAKGTVEQTLRVVRDIAMLLRPSMLDDLGLAPAIAWLLKETGRAGGFETRADIDPVADQLPEAHRTCVYRVFQEALTNASRHSGASTLEVSMKKVGDAVLGTIADNGRGFESSPRTARGLGLLGMEERVKELGGSIRIASTRKGTTIDFHLPVPTHKESDDDQDSDSGRSRDRASRAEATP